MKPSAKPTFKIFIVEDEAWYRQLLYNKLTLNPEFSVQAFETAEDLLDEMAKKPDLIFIDIMLPDITGDKLLKIIRKKNKAVKVVIISGQSDIRLAIDLLRNGGDEYLVKDKDSLSQVWNYAMKTFREREDSTNQKTSEPSENSLKATSMIIGNSDAMKQLRSLIEKTSRSSITVSISGETGTGKELVAKAVHLSSPRADKPFLAVNVASIPKDLLESELFGHEKGAFTGAVSTRLGKFEEANGGTLFLDEISELDISLQSKLLRVLQEKEVVRVGSNKTIPLNVRIIISTNKSLLAEVKKKNFREDLYYRFLGFTIELPPMRERLSDLGALSDYFIAEFCKENNMKIKTISPKGIEKLMKYNFPGNIRELRAIIELAAALSGDSTNIGEDAIVLEATEETFDVPKEEMSLDDYNRKLILHYLKKYNNKVLVVAEKLGIGKSTIYNLLKSNDKAKKDDESLPELPK
ncbi:MAG: sigma-54 dependent transcriptional regulator [Bacteroidetes bacterium]|nr:sigma-54 dependent transcriptional regulator [Bacteroidota bacterium]